MFSLNSFCVCSLSYHPGATPLKLFRATTWDREGGTEKAAGGSVVGREGIARRGGNGSRGQRNQEHPARLETCPRPRDPTACWKEEFPKGNRGRSSSLSRTGKLGKANGLVWSGQLSGSDQTSAETGPEGRKEVGAPEQFSKWVSLSPTPLSGHWPSLAAPTGTGGWLFGSPLSKWHSSGRILGTLSQSRRAGHWQGRSSKGVGGPGVGGRASDDVG